MIDRNLGVLIPLRNHALVADEPQAARRSHIPPEQSIPRLNDSRSEVPAESIDGSGSETNPPTITIIIDRQNWGRGSEEGSYLYANWREAGKFCIFGAVLRQAGVAPETMNAIKSPEYIAELVTKGKIDLPQWAREMLIRDEGWVAEITDLNDSDACSDAEREEKLSQLFSESGVTLKFIN